MKTRSRNYSRYAITGTEVEAMAKLVPFFAARGESIVMVDKFDADSVVAFKVLALSDAAVIHYRVAVYGEPRIEATLQIRPR